MDGNILALWWSILRDGDGGEGRILIKCNISSSMLEVVGEVWTGILLCKLDRIVMGPEGCGW